MRVDVEVRAQKQEGGRAEAEREEHEGPAAQPVDEQHAAHAAEQLAARLPWGIKEQEKEEPVRGAQQRKRQHAKEDRRIGLKKRTTGAESQMAKERSSAETCDRPEKKACSRIGVE